MRTLLKSRLDEMKRENLGIRATLLQVLGTDPSPVDIQAIQGTTLSLAVSLRRLDWIQQMVDHGAHLGDCDYTGTSALHIAATSNQVSVARFLLDNKFPHDVRDRFNQTALDCALAAKSYESAEVLEIETQRGMVHSMSSTYHCGDYIPIQAHQKLPRANSEIQSRSSSVPKLPLDGLGPKSLSNPQIQIIQAEKEGTNSSRRLSDATRKAFEAQASTYLSDSSDSAKQRSGSSSKSRESKGIKKFLFDNFRASNALTSSSSSKSSSEHGTNVKSGSTPAQPEYLCQVPHCKCKIFKQVPQDPTVCDCGHYRASHRSITPLVAPAQSNPEEAIMQGLEGLKFVSEDQQLLILQDPESAADWPKVINMKLVPDGDLKEFKAAWADRFGAWTIDPLDVVFNGQLGVGSSCIVYEATFKGKPAAVKVMNMKPLKMKSKAKQRQELLEEFSVLTSVESDHVLKFYGIIVEPVICLVTEFCANGTLRDILDPPPFVPTVVDWRRGLELFLHALLGVEALHSRSPPVVHRDLKTLNLLVDSQMQLKVSDFGLSRFLLNAEQQTTLAKLRGTYTYTYAAACMLAQE
jgi:tRNA A-37 threonylcarbamoyl transferase component Bud32